LFSLWLFVLANFFAPSPHRVVTIPHQVARKSPQGGGANLTLQSNFTTVFRKAFFTCKTPFFPFKSPSFSNNPFEGALARAPNFFFGVGVIYFLLNKFQRTQFFLRRI